MNFILERVSTKKSGASKSEEIPKKSHNLTSIRQDEVIAALAMSDGVVLLVDCVVGLTQYLGFCLEKNVQQIWKNKRPNRSKAYKILLKVCFEAMLWRFIQLEYHWWLGVSSVFIQTILIHTLCAGTLREWWSMRFRISWRWALR